MTSEPPIDQFHPFAVDEDDSAEETLETSQPEGAGDGAAPRGPRRRRSPKALASEVNEEYVPI